MTDLTAPIKTVGLGDPAVRNRSDDPRATAFFVVGALVLAAATVLLRLYNQTTSYELFVDEIQYADIANSFAAGRGPELFGGPFFLHPPLYFALVSLFVGPPVDHLTVEFVLGLRWVVLFFAAANSLLVVAIARRVTGRRTALLAGALYALDPFIIRFDSRLMLEAPTMAVVLLGLLAALVAVESVGGRRRALLIAAGVVFGIALVTKSTAALITTVPLILMTVSSSGPRRKEAAGMLGLQVGVYAIYVAWIWAGGHLGDWFGQTLTGIVRISGVAPETGFNSEGAPAFLDRVQANLGQFGPSYLLIIVAVGAIAVLLFEDIRSRRSSGRHVVLDGGNEVTVRMLTVWLVGVVVAIAYTFFFGEVEEQSFYLMAVPATIVIAVLIARTSYGRAARVFVTAGTIATLIFSAAVWWAVHNRPDDTYLRLVSFLEPQRGGVTVVALGEATGQFVLPGFGITGLDGIDRSPGYANYMLVSTQLSSLGLAPASLQQIADYDRRFPVVFTASGRSTGKLKLYDLDNPRPGATR